jgi:hypothetical protein
MYIAISFETFERSNLQIHALNIITALVKGRAHADKVSESDRQTNFGEDYARPFEILIVYILSEDFPSCHFQNCKNNAILHYVRGVGEGTENRIYLRCTRVHPKVAGL